MNKSSPERKSFQIPKQLVWEAYLKVKANDGAAGVDGVSVEDFEKDLKNNLYKIWNRMSSGTYFPPAVLGVEVPKSHGGGMRLLGVPTVADRVAQTVAALALEPKTESLFHEDSFGYRPGRSAEMALTKCRARCWQKDWVLDLDVAKFFDSVDHDRMVKAVEANITPDQKWVVLYVRRWLVAPIRMPDGRLVDRDQGTPQGSAVSPVLANLFMHYAFDTWLARAFPTVSFERYADDAVVHCATEGQARRVWAALEQRLAEVGLRLHPDKTKIVYCKDAKRRADYPNTSFTFLGFTFQARRAQGKGKKVFSGFLPAMSDAAQKAKGEQLRRWRVHLKTTLDLADIAEWLNPIVRGWMSYYGTFYRSEMYGLLRRINTYLMRWARRKYKRLKAFKRAQRWWWGLVRREPTLFAHWAWEPYFEWAR